MSDTDRKDIEELVRDGASQLGFEEATETKAVEVLEEVDGVEAAETPNEVAAGVLYGASLFCNDKATMREVAEVVDAPPETVREVYSDIVSQLGLGI